MGIADLGPLCTADFKVSLGAAVVYEEIARFATPSYVGELFRSMPLEAMLRSVEANATKVRVVFYFFYSLRPSVLGLLWPGLCPSGAVLFHPGVFFHFVEELRYYVDRLAN